MKKLLLLALLVIGCGGSASSQGEIVKTFTNSQGEKCFFLEDTSTYTDYATGVYCKE